MSVVKINAITVPGGRGEELAGRFAKRAGRVEGQPGFEEFQLLRPADGRDTWLVYTRWKDEESFQAWVSGADFQHGHRGPEGAGQPAPPPVAMSAELWEFTVEQQTGARV
jgi:heme-degrading monooxygenase HmoA